MPEFPLSERELFCGAVGSADDGEDVLLGEKNVFVGSELDVGAGVLAVEDAVTHAHFERLTGTVVVAPAGADLHHFADLGLLLGGIREKDSTGGFLLGLRDLDEDAVAEGFDSGNAERYGSHRGIDVGG
jgi:hypothetical protein